MLSPLAPYALPGVAARNSCTEVIKLAPLGDSREPRAPGSHPACMCAGRAPRSRGPALHVIAPR
eukprot:1346153-Alexandrium_andersonii.AAC.1